MNWMGFAQIFVMLDHAVMTLDWQSHGWEQTVRAVLCKVTIAIYGDLQLPCNEVCYKLMGSLEN